MKPVDKEDTINKAKLLNRLYSADKELPILELGRKKKKKTDGRYVLIKTDNVKPLSSLDEIKHK